MIPVMSTPASGSPQGRVMAIHKAIQEDRNSGTLLRLLPRPFSLAPAGVNGPDTSRVLADPEMVIHLMFILSK